MFQRQAILDPGVTLYASNDPHPLLTKKKTNANKVLITHGGPNQGWQTIMFNNVVQLLVFMCTCMVKEMQMRSVVYAVSRILGA